MFGMLLVMLEIERVFVFGWGVVGGEVGVYGVVSVGLLVVVLILGVG